MLDGDYDGPSVFGARIIELSGALVAPDRSTLQVGMDRIGAVLASTTRRAPLTFDEGQRGLIRQAVVRLNGPTMVARTSAVTADWSMSLYAADPLRYSEELHEIQITRATEGVGRTYDLRHDRVYGSAGSGGFGTVYNAGNASTAPLIVFGQQLGTPEIGIVGGDHIRLNATIGVSAWVDVDCHARTVLYHNDATDPGVNRRSWMSSDSRWLSFPPGYTDLYFTVLTGGGRVYVRWRDAWA
jgi:hypothetical protein